MWFVTSKMSPKFLLLVRVDAHRASSSVAPWTGGKNPPGNDVQHHGQRQGGLQGGGRSRLKERRKGEGGRQRETGREGSRSQAARN